MTVAAYDNPRLLERARTAVIAAGIAAGSTVVGAGLMAAAWSFGPAAPAVLLAFPLAPALAVLILAQPLAGVVAVVATFPVGTIDVPALFATMEVVDLAVALAAVLIVLRRLGTGKTPLPWVPPLWWALALIGWVVLALPSAADRDRAVTELITLTGGIALVCVVLASVSTMAHVRIVLGVLVASAAVVTGLALMESGSLAAAHGGTVISGRAQGAPFGSPNEMGSLCSLGALVALGLVAGARSKWGRIGAAAGGALLLWGLLLSLSRGAWIGTTAALLFLVITLVEARRILAVGGALLIVVAVLMGEFAPRSPQVTVVGERISSLTTTGPYDDRPAIWAEARQEAMADPWTGQGPGSFPVASVRAGSASSSVYAEHAHNLLLTWAAENGIPAALLIVGFSAALAVAGRRAARKWIGSERRNRAVVLAVGAALISLAGQGLVDYTLRNAVVFMSLWLLVGVLLAAARMPAPAGRSAAASRDGRRAGPSSEQAPGLPAPRPLPT